MRALISVSDKSGLVEFAQDLTELGVEIISTGGTHAALAAAGIPVTEVSDVTGFPEVLDGRVKTLHPAIHAGLLAVRANPEHMATLTELGITPIDLVVVNLYPFKETIAKPDVAFEDAIENIDIGGPSMIRAAAKNAASVGVVVDPADYQMVAAELRDHGKLSAATRTRLQAKAFRHTAAYDALIAQYLTAREGTKFPETLTVTFEKKQPLRYGENSHQKAAYYADPLPAPGSITAAKQLHGKELSFNNIKDVNAAASLLNEFEECAAVAIKHQTPCGVGLGTTPAEAFARCFAGDPVSIFGGIVAFNRPVTLDLAQRLHEMFLEVIIAPAFDADAREVLEGKKNVRLLELSTSAEAEKGLELFSVTGGALVEDRDTELWEPRDLFVMTRREPTAEEMKRLKFGFRVVKHTRSNAIVLVNGVQTVGIGAGQMNRVGSAKLAIEEAMANGFDLSEAVLASDAYFPMPDTLELAGEHGIKAVIQPSGSIRDQDSVDVADKYGMAMVGTKMRHFKH